MDYNKMPTNSFEHFYLSWMPDKSKIKRPYYLTLANALEADIVSGKLVSGTRLPPQRELADYLDLNFTTVTQAYNLCRERRLIYGVTGKGTFVSPLPGKNVIHHSGNQPGVIELGLLKGFDQIKAPIIEASKNVLQKGYIEELYSYTEAAGHLHQRVAGAHWMKQMGVNTDSEHTAIFSGAQNIISATLLSLFKIGDKIAVDEYTYSNLLGMARLSHIRLIPVRGDADGMDAGGAGAEFRASGGIHDHRVAGGQGNSVGIEIIYLLTRAELDLHHGYILRGSSFRLRHRGGLLLGLCDYIFHR